MYLTSKKRTGIEIQREVTLDFYWVTFWRENADFCLCSPMAYVTNYWALVNERAVNLEIVMPFEVANDCLNTSPQWHSCTGVRTRGRYGIHASRLPDRNIIGLDCYFTTLDTWELSTFDRPQGIWEKQNLREKWRPDGTGFKGSNFRDFFVPAGHMACMRLGKKKMLSYR